MSGLVPYSSQQSLITNYYNLYIDSEVDNSISLQKVGEMSSALPSYQWICHIKGALVAHLMNQEIIEITGGEKSLHSLIQYLLEWYRKYTTDDILKAINAITKSNFEEFFRKFIYGTDKIEKSMLKPLPQLESNLAVY